MNIERFIQIAPLIVLTIFLIGDYFPSLAFMPVGIFIFLMAAFIVSSAFFKGLRGKVSPKGKILVTSYIVGLIIMLNVLGGYSTVGLDFYNPILWIGIIISVFSIMSDYHQLKQDKRNQTGTAKKNS